MCNDKAAYKCYFDILFSLNRGTSLLYNVKVAWCYKACYNRYFKWNDFIWIIMGNDKLADKCSIYSDILFSIYSGTSLLYNVKVAWH